MLEFFIAAGSLGLGGFLFAINVSKDMQKMLHSINKNAASKRYSKRTLKHLIEFIQLQSDIKQLSSFYVNFLVHLYQG